MEDIEKTILNLEEERILKKSLFDFVIRVANPDAKRTTGEVAVLPAVAKLVIDYFVEKF